MPTISEHTRQIYSTFPGNFILWKSVQKAGKPKPDKVPCTPEGMPCNPLDASNHMSFSQALVIAENNGLNIGFVLTDNHNIACIDIDGGRDSLERDWHNWCNQFVDQFPGSFFEVSPSGLGGHIWLKADKSRLDDRRNKWGEGRFEYYQTGRFISVCTGYPANNGQIIDCTERLLEVVPAHETITEIEKPQSGPVPEWNGPTDDTVLINKAMNAAGSAAVQFGEKASFRSLWTCDVAKLTQVFPSPSGDDFDRSSADAALMSHLAFWTGKDYTRIDRLFRQSGLMREKYDTRPDYQQNTITGAIRHCQNVYTGGAQDSHNSGTVANGIRLLGALEQQQHFAGCVHISAYNKILTPKGLMLGESAFNSTYGGYDFAMRSDNTKPTDKAWNAFTLSQIVDFPRADILNFEPSKPFGEITVDDYGVSFANSYRPHNVRRVQGDVSPFLDFMGKLIPDENDRDILLSYMAGLSRYTGVKAMWSPILIGSHGIGKSTIIRLIEYMIDGTKPGQIISDPHCQKIESHSLGGRFNCNFLNRTFAYVEELHTTSYTDSMSRLQTIKGYITDPVIQIECKGRDADSVPNRLNFLFCSNHKDAIRIEPTERRFSIFYAGSDQGTGRNGLTPDYHKKFYGWLFNDGFAKIAHYLHNELVIPENFDFSKGANEAPKTSHHDLAVYQSRSGNEQTLIDVLADSETQGLRGGMASSGAVSQGFVRAGVEKPPATKTLNGLMERCGYLNVGQATKNIGASRPRLYVRADMRTQLEQQADQAGGWTALYMALNGYGDMPSNIIPLTKGTS